MTKDIKSKLMVLRKKINQIDKIIIKLLYKRSYIIPKVKKIKEKHINYKVAFDREYKIAKKLQVANFGLYSNVFIQKIWRELISATLKIECNLTIGILKDTNNYVDMWELTKDHFGVYTNLILIEDTQNLLDMLIDKKIDVAILPHFNSTDNKWWALLGQPQYKNIKINLELPLFKDFKTLNANKCLCLSLNNEDKAEVLFYILQTPTAEVLNNKDNSILDSINLAKDSLYLASTKINLKDINKDSIYIGSTPIKI